MRAVWYERNGPAREVLVVGDLPDPHPGPGEVRVRIHASGLNPSDIKRRLGFGGQAATGRIVPNSDGAGVIDEVGAGVSSSRLGERVWVHSAQWGRPSGTNAEFCVLPAKLCAPLPEGVSFEAGACLAIPAITAHRALYADGPIAGQTVLVTGGAGAVGHYAIQIAKAGGARVIATVSSPQKAALARQAGADAVVDYRQENAAERIVELTDGAGVDRIVEVDFGGNLKTSLALFPPAGESVVPAGAGLMRARKVLKENGVIAAYASHGDERPTLPFYPMMTRGLTLRMIFFYWMTDAQFADAIAEVNRLAPTMLHNIAGVFPLDRTAEAHEAQESGRLFGNIVIAVP